MAVRGKGFRRNLVVIIAVITTVVVLASAYWMTSGILVSTRDCPIPSPPIIFFTHSGSGELVFVSYRHTYVGEPLVSELGYELAYYPSGTDRLGPGNVMRSGSLSNLNTSGQLQFHDMEAETEFSPGNDFFILVSPPSDPVQLRIIRAGTPIAWNMLVGCI